MIATTNGLLLTTLRRADGSWEGIRSMAPALGITGTPTNVTAAAVGGSAHYYVVASDGRVWHTTRAADGTWQPATVQAASNTLPQRAADVTASGDGSVQIQVAVIERAA